MIDISDNKHIAILYYIISSIYRTWSSSVVNAALQHSRRRFTHSHLIHSFLLRFCTYMCPSKQILSFPCDVLIISIITVLAIIMTGLAIYATICVLVAWVHAIQQARCDFYIFDTADDMWYAQHRRLLIISINTSWVILLYVPPKSPFASMTTEIGLTCFALMNHSVACMLT